MPSNDTPLNKAHQHASNAEDYVNRGLLVPAAEEHYKSAEAFLLCVEQARDDGTKRTLRMLYNEHSKSGKELQRKIAKLKEEGKDPDMPQVSHAVSPTERAYEPPLPLGFPTVPSPYTTPRGRMSESNHPIDESYMVLGQQSDHTFNEFWKVFEGMLDNLSQPVAFATAPLARPQPSGLAHPQSRDPESSSDKRAVLREASDEASFKVESIAKYSGRTFGLGQPGRQAHTLMPETLSKSHGVDLEKVMRRNVVPDKVEVLDNSDPEEVSADPDSPSGESFFMIPSASGSSTSRLQKENTSLQSEVESLKQRLELAERMRIEQEQQIREGISQARREAQRVISSSYMPQRPTQPPVDFGTLNVSPVFPMGARDREAPLMRRIKELEEEVKTVRAENEKQKAMIIKFRERWEKLKESAKRKRNAKANALESVRERIEEEPDAEAEVGAEAEVSC